MAILNSLEILLQQDGFSFDGNSKLNCDWSLIRIPPNKNTKYYYLDNDCEKPSGLTYTKELGKDFTKEYLPCATEFYRKVAFLDRDGILIEDTVYPGKIEDVVFKKKVFPLLKFLQENGYELIVLTNQSGIARGKYTEQDFRDTTLYIKDYYLKNGIEILDTYFCPYLKDANIDSYNKESILRKPLPGMALKAACDHKIDFSKSVMIGDKLTDILKTSFLSYFIINDNNHPHCHANFEEVIISLSKI